MSVGNHTKVFLAKQNHFLGIESTDLCSEHIIDDARVF